MLSETMNSHPKSVFLIKCLQIMLHNTHVKMQHVLHLQCRDRETQTQESKEQSYHDLAIFADKNTPTRVASEQAFEKRISNCRSSTQTKPQKLC